MNLQTAYRRTSSAASSALSSPDYSPARKEFNFRTLRQRSCAAEAIVELFKLNFSLSALSDRISTRRDRQCADSALVAQNARRLSCSVCSSTLIKAISWQRSFGRGRCMRVANRRLRSSWAPPFVHCYTGLSRRALGSSSHEKCFD